MNFISRFLGLIVLGFAVFGVFHVISHPPDLRIERPSLTVRFRDESPVAPVSLASPTEDETVRLTVAPGLRMAFDHPTCWIISTKQYAEVWWCDGESGVIAGASTLRNVCAIAIHNA